MTAQPQLAETPSRLLAARTRRLASSAIGSVLRLGDRADLIGLAAGSPAPESFCVAEVAEVTARLLATRPDALQYGDTAGLTSLRERVAAHTGALLGRTVPVDETILAHGSQQALDLVCKAMLDPGDVVVVDRPSYVGALQVFRLFQADVVGVPIAADEGLEELARRFAAGLRPKLIYVVPNYANPTGATLSAAQRGELVRLAGRYGCLVVEDDPYGDLGYTDAEPPPSLAALSPDVIRLGSFSKVLFPAARLGHLTVPRALAPVLNTLKQAADLGNSHLIELIVDELLDRPGFLAAQLHRARGLYRARRDTLVAALDREFGAELQFRSPDGGFFVWARLAAGTDATALLAEALAEGVSFVPGAAFYADDPEVDFLRLAFSCAPVPALAEAPARLRRAWSRLGTGPAGPAASGQAARADGPA